MTDPSRMIGPFIAIVSLGAFLVALAQVDWSLVDLFLTPDQRGQWWMERHDYTRAAAVFEDPVRRGVAQYRAGDYKVAAASFGQAETPEAFYNRGNAELMLGNYVAAIAAYQQALALRPDWRQARENLELARRRWQHLQPKNEGDLGTGGFLSPDEIVFDKRAANAPDNQKQTVAGGEQGLSDVELRALWLRRVQTRPADFLRAKFSYQAAHEQTEGRDAKQSEGER